MDQQSNQASKTWDEGAAPSNLAINNLIHTLYMKDIPPLASELTKVRIVTYGSQTPNHNRFRFATFPSPLNRPYRWQFPGSLTYRMSPNVLSLLKSTFLRSVVLWSGASQGVLKLTPSNINPKIRFSQSASPLDFPDPRVLGFADIFANPSTGYLILVEIVMNTKDFIWRRTQPVLIFDRTRFKFSVNADAVTLHELGHALGLAHSDPTELALQLPPGTFPTMHATLKPGADTLEKDDINGIRSLYPKAL